MLELYQSIIINSNVYSLYKVEALLSDAEFKVNELKREGWCGDTADGYNL